MPDAVPHATSEVESAPVPTRYWGVWRRDWIERRSPSGALTRSIMPAVWFQAKHHHVDLRVDPALAHTFQAVDCNASIDLDVHDRPTQLAFAGITTVRMQGQQEVCSWHPFFAYPALSSEADQGVMEFLTPTHLIETALDGSYQESWRRISSDGAPLHCEIYPSAHSPGCCVSAIQVSCGEFFAIGCAQAPCTAHPHPVTDATSHAYFNTLPAPWPLYAWGTSESSATGETVWHLRESLTP